MHLAGRFFRLQQEGFKLIHKQYRALKYMLEYRSRLLSFLGFPGVSSQHNTSLTPDMDAALVTFFAQHPTLFSNIDSRDIIFQLDAATMYERWAMLGAPDFIVSGQASLFPLSHINLPRYPNSTNPSDNAPYINSGWWVGTLQGVIKVLSRLYERDWCTEMKGKYSDRDQCTFHNMVITHGFDVLVDRTSLISQTMQPRNFHRPAHRSVTPLETGLYFEAGRVHRPAIHPAHQTPVLMHWSGTTKDDAFCNVTLPLCYQTYLEQGWFAGQTAVLRIPADPGDVVKAEWTPIDWNCMCSGQCADERGSDDKRRVR